MTRYDFFLNPSGRGYLVVLQSDLLDALNTVVVAPLMPVNEAPPPITRLNPCFEVEAGRFVLLTQFVAAVPIAVLKTRVGSLADHSDVISNALDLLFYGF